MSKYCGKCDFADHLEIFGTEKPMKVFVGDKEIDCSTEKERALYYPYLIGVSVGDANGQVIHLTRMSYIRIQEEDTLEYIRDQLLVAYRRCKRKKIQFTYENATSKIWRYYLEGPYENVTKEIYNRINTHADSADVYDLRIDGGMNVCYRHEWYEELVRLGWDKDFAEDWVRNY